MTSNRRQRLLPLKARIERQLCETDMLLETCTTIAARIRTPNLTLRTMMRGFGNWNDSERICRGMLDAIKERLANPSTES